MSKLLCSVLKISGEANAPLVARLVSNNEHSMKMIIVAWAIHSL